MAKKQFKAESKKLLDLMINSIYTHKEIFLRELISNASDALDKLYYRSLTSGDTGIKKNDFVITIKTDRDAGTITISDNGVGMTKDELESNLGTIARSGSQSFKAEHDGDAKEDKAIDIIGQFGVGFYSAFMVSDKVTVLSKAYGSDTAWKWESSGADGYTVTEGEKKDNGTEILLHIKENSEDEDYSHFLEDYTIKDLVKRYSDYIRYPIRMDGETLNTMEPIWKRQKSKVKPEDYNEYYKSKFGDWEDPARVIRTAVEGVSSYTALLFIPSHTPFDYYTKDYEKGLQLYSSGVMIMDKCQELLPDYFNFVKGLVDSQDLSLNISRETLQHDRQLRNIAKNLEKKIKRELETFLNGDREGYEKFYSAFGRQLKYGVYDDFGAHKDVLKDLLLFYSNTEKKNVTLAEYVSRMKEDQKFIYYAAGESNEKIDILPQTEYIDSKGYEILYLTDEIDEFALQMMQDYNDKLFKSVASEDMTTEESDEEKEAMKKADEENKDLLAYMKEVLGDRVTEVKLSSRLKSSAVCLTAKGGLSLEMEKVLNSMPAERQLHADRVLEINPNHKITEILRGAMAEGDEGKVKVKVCTQLLYDQSLLLNGMSVDDPALFSENLTKLITETI